MINSSGHYEAISWNIGVLYCWVFYENKLVSATMATQMSKNRKFGADGVIYAELNKVFRRELTEDSYSGGKVSREEGLRNPFFFKMDECDVENFIAFCWAICGARNSQIMEGECRDYGEVLSYAIKTGNSKPGFCCAVAVG